MNRKFDHVISAALCDTQAYDSNFNKFNCFALTFHFLSPKRRDLPCSQDIMLRTKQIHAYTYYNFIQYHSTTNTPSRIVHHRLQFINSNFSSPFFLNFIYCIKDTNMQRIIRNYDPIRQMYIFCPLNKTFSVDESRPLIVPQEYIQPVENPILECIHNIKLNHKLHNLIQNTPYELPPSSEEHKIIKALELL